MTANGQGPGAEQDAEGHEEDWVEGEYSDEVVEVPIDGTLDLHNFRPQEIKELIPDYARECMERGIFSLRIVHGKGTGALRKSVHAILDRMPEVDSYRLAGMGGGSWGATLVALKRPLLTP